MITIFEQYQSKNWIEIDYPYLTVFIKNGTLDKPQLEGQIWIYIREDKNESYRKYLLASGIPKLLGTKYEYDNKFRNMEIDYSSNNIISNNSLRSMIRTFIKKEFGYKGDLLKIRSYELSLKYQFSFNNDIKTIGDYIEEVKKFKDEVCQYELMRTQIKKFNL